MKEARIECLIREFPVHDLGLSMKKGQVEFVAAELARRSVDLANASRLGAVRVRYVERARTMKPAPRPPPPPNVRLPRRRPLPVTAAEPVLTVDVEEIKAAAANAARDATRDAVEEMKAAMIAALASRPTVVVSSPSPGNSTPVDSGPAEPVFIPGNIVNKEATIRVASNSSDAGDMDAAAEALKNRRGSRKKKE